MLSTLDGTANNKEYIMKTVTILNNNISEIFASVKTSASTEAVSNHGGTHEVYGVFELANNKLAPLLDLPIYCLNRLYVGEDGKLHVSTWSVGGNVMHGAYQGTGSCALVAVHTFENEKELIEFVKNHDDELDEDEVA